jgi:hypothetical protein
MEVNQKEQIKKQTFSFQGTLNTTRTIASPAVPVAGESVLAAVYSKREKHVKHAFPFLSSLRSASLHTTTVHEVQK